VARQKRELPWRKEFDKQKFLRVNDRLEVGRDQIDDVGRPLSNDKSGE
jgi:hypothetical protein